MNYKDREFFTTNEVSQQLGVSVGTVQNLVDKGYLDAILTAGGHRRIRVESLKSYLQKMGYKATEENKCIYVIHSDESTDIEKLNINKKMPIKLVTNPLELMALQECIDCIFIDAKCRWLDDSSVNCINKFADKLKIIIYNFNFIKSKDILFSKAVIMLQCDISDSILDAYICGVMQ